MSKSTNSCLSTAKNTTAVFLVSAVLISLNAYTSVAVGVGMLILFAHACLAAFGRFVVLPCFFVWGVSASLLDGLLCIWQCQSLRELPKPISSYLYININMKNNFPCKTSYRSHMIAHLDVNDVNLPGFDNTPIWYSVISEGPIYNLLRTISKHAAPSFSLLLFAHTSFRGQTRSSSGYIFQGTAHKSP